MTPMIPNTPAPPTLAPRYVRERGAGGPDRPGRGERRRAQEQRSHKSPELPVRFALGRLTATPGALAALEHAGANPAVYLARHAACDWGDVDAEDRAANDRALVDGARLLSAYGLPDGTTIWVITEADRSVTIMCIQPASPPDSPR
jgi:hypothetical protein